MPFTHLFYHQETVEEGCAINSWKSIQPFIGMDDELILLDLGNSLRKLPTLRTTPKYFRVEKIRTDTVRERSYTFGLNLILPTARNEWVFLWRSDYIYHQDHMAHYLEHLENVDAVVPYEVLIGGEFTNGNWCSSYMPRLCRGSFDDLLPFAHVCPVYEYSDFPHFAIRKSAWQALGGMDERLFGYGPQFPEFFVRFEKKNKLAVDPKLISFHQNHAGSFSLGNYSSDKKIELEESEAKLMSVFPDQGQYNEYQQYIHRPPLSPRRAPWAYQPKQDRWRKLFKRISRRIGRLLNPVS